MEISPRRTRSPVIFFLAAAVVFLVTLGAVFLLIAASPEETSDPASLLGSYTAPDGGYTIALPAGWAASPLEDSGALTSEVQVMVAGPSQEAIASAGSGINSLNFAVAAPVVIVMSASTQDAPLPVLSPRLVFEFFKNEMPVQDDLRFGLTRDLTVGGTGAASTDFDGVSRDGQSHFSGRVVTILWADQAGFFVGVAPHRSMAGVQARFQRDAPVAAIF